MSLDFKVNAKVISAAVGVVGGAVTGRSSLPILSHILIESDGDSLRLTGTDLEIGISCKIPAFITSEGNVAAPKEMLAKFLGTFGAADDVLFSMQGTTALLKCKKSSTKLLSLMGDDYPSLPVVDGTTFTIPQSALQSALKKVMPAASTDETRAIITGILMVAQPDGMAFVATDTHRLTKVECDVEGIGELRCVLPSKTAREIVRLSAATEGDIKITISGDAGILFELPGSDELKIKSRLIDGAYPSFERVIPAVDKVNRIATFDTEALRVALKRIEPVAKENSSRCIFSFSNTTLKLSAESHMIGSTEDEIEIETNNTAPFTIAFNVGYVITALSTVTDDQCSLRLQPESSKPALLTPVNSLDILTVLMPMQMA